MAGNDGDYIFYFLDEETGFLQDKSLQKCKIGSRLYFISGKMTEHKQVAKHVPDIPSFFATKEWLYRSDMALLYALGEADSRTFY